jgi:hypothetical protein
VDEKQFDRERARQHQSKIAITIIQNKKQKKKKKKFTSTNNSFNSLNERVATFAIIRLKKSQSNLNSTSSAKSAFCN